MRAYQSLFLSFTLPLAAVADTTLGLYIFSREGDRTALSTPPTVLTELGYVQEYGTGSWYRNQYIANGASNRIWNLQPNKPQYSQINALAPLDNVMMSSATAFWQGLYPPVGNNAATAGLRNGSTVTEPLNGYQIIPIQQTTLNPDAGITNTKTSLQGSTWLEGGENCNKAINSTNRYYASSDFYYTSNQTQSFYQSIAPVVANTFPNPASVNYQNAYNVYDLINVAETHNSSFPNSNAINGGNFQQLQTLANQHEFNLAFNQTDPIRAVAGATLAGQIVQTLNATVNSGGTVNLLNVQFGSYLTMFSFFGLSNLTDLAGTGTQFMGIPDYASTMVFELYTTSSPSPFPPADQLSVRFYFQNGTANNFNTPQQYPLFGVQSLSMTWQNFQRGMSRFAISDQTTWCNACENEGTGTCQIVAKKSRITPAVGGVIGTFVTLIILAAVLVALMLCLGLRCIRRPRRMGPRAMRHEKGIVKT